MAVVRIELHAAIHRGENRIFIKFIYDPDIVKLIRQLDGLKWSASQRAWHVEYDDFNILKLNNIFDDEAYRIYWFYHDISSSDTQENNQSYLLSKEAQIGIAQFELWLKSRRYSVNTISTYTDAIKVFLRFFAGRKIEDINNDDIIQFNNDYILAKKFSASYQNQVVNAIKLFFREVIDTSIDVNLVHRPKREKKLPNVLSKEEIKLILDAPANIKHRTMLILIYSCGLRRSELLNLRLDNVDVNRNLLIIKQAKGRKDRVVPLSDKTIEVLKDYHRFYKPQNFLFEGQGGEQYSERSLSHVLDIAIEKVGIKKPVTLHWLRHSYATHLLESGTDLRYIQEILGHSSSKTTEIYTHVSTKSIQKIKSPFDDL